MTKTLHNIERIYASIRDITYILFQEKDSPYLVVSFAAYFPAKASYSYITAFEGVPCNRLYILDNFGYDNKGCWYLCEGLNFNVEYAVIDLIRHIQQRCSVRNENVITIGSSKGGWCAIYYALKYDFGYVAVGAPQIMLGRYLNDGIENKRHILNGMIGEITQEKVEMLDQLLLKQIVPNKNIHLYFHHGLGDWHIDLHFRQFVDHSNNFISNIYSDIQPYSGHEKLMNFFPKYLHDTVATIVSGNSTELMKKKVHYSVRIDQLLNEITARTTVCVLDGSRITVELPLRLDNTQFAIYLLDARNNPIHKAMYQKESKFEINGIDTASIRAVQIFFRNSIGEIKMKTKLINETRGQKEVTI